MKIKNLLTCVRDKAKWKDVVEKAKTPIKGGSAPEEEKEEDWNDRGNWRKKII
jgi:hypothetical protein